MGLTLTWLDNNSWLWLVGGQRILVDPWLVGTLTFGNQAWLFKGERASAPLPEVIDGILLSQGLPDHAHVPTLATLDRGIPVLGSASAAGVARRLGYRRVTPLRPGESATLGQITIKAVAGAPIGPTSQENGYILRDRQTGLSLFYEPHGFHGSSLRTAGPIEVVITPVVDLTLPLVGPIIRGRNSALERVEWLQPQLLLPTAAAGQTLYSGFLANLLTNQGTVTELQHQLQRRGHATQVLSPVVGQPIAFPGL
ncbi:MAG: MBL fold metallo-hydrolase [Cyanobacteria bacterium REEB459]|nr:MBL fold metallo-hydrolase [Cyanobacteria bacterium REEB459]